jgi:hypothetical protein
MYFCYTLNDNFSFSYKTWYILIQYSLVLLVLLALTYNFCINLWLHGYHPRGLKALVNVKFKRLNCSSLDLNFTCLFVCGFQEFQNCISLSFKNENLFLF